VSFSAMVTLAHAGADVVALITDLPKQQSYAAFAFAAAARWRVPVWASTTVRRVQGCGRLAAVELTDVRTGAVRRVECETLVFTGDWIPDHELARAAGLAIDPGTRGPAVDTRLETSVPYVFAAGNLVHAAETADVAALGGIHAARHISAGLSAGCPPARRVLVTVAPPLAWISPNAIRIPMPADTPATRASAPVKPAPSNAAPASPPRGRFLLRSQVFRQRAVLEVRQGDRVLARETARLIPGRPVHLDAGWLAGVRPSDGPVSVALVHG
jgi:hypothetical protein